MDALVVDAVRTPRGKARPDGGLAGVRPVALVAACVEALRGRVGIGDGDADDLLLGCVTAVDDQGANVARMAALWSGLGDAVPGATVNRFCASGLDAIATAAARVSAGDALVLAGGVESVSRVPMFADRGSWFADPEVAERTGFVHMGVAADLLATRAELSRAVLDAIGLRSQERAAAAEREGRASRSRVPVREGERVILDRDELPRETSAEKLAALPPAFGELGGKGGDAVALARYPELDAVAHRHTVGTSPALADGAALAVIASKEGAARLGAAPRARVRAFAHVGVEPVQMLDGNLEATRRALRRAGLAPGDVDLFEVNESFAAVVAQYERELGLDPARVNPNGGAIALGHPLGATGGVLLSAALDELERADGGLAVISICGGAGVATALVVERL